MEPIGSSVVSRSGALSAGALSQYSRQAIPFSLQESSFVDDYSMIADLALNYRAS